MVRELLSANAEFHGVLIRNIPGIRRSQNLFDDLSTAAPAITREAALARDPELILASAPPESAQAWLDEWRRFSTLTAVRKKQLIAYSDERIDRMGPSVIAATAQLCEVIDKTRNSSGITSPKPVVRPSK